MTMVDEPRVDTAEESEFRARVRAFLDGHCHKRRSRRAEEDGADAEQEDEGTSMLDPDSASLIARAKAYQAALVDAGLGFLTWPKRYGGAELTKRHVEIFNEVAADYEIPNAIFTIGHGMCAPTAPRVRQRRAEGQATSRTCCGATGSGASCTRSRERVRTWRHCRRAPSATATSGC